MGPMMGGSAGGSAPVFWLILVGLLILGLGLVALAVWGTAGSADRWRPRSPVATVGERYARGELTRQQYRDALVDLLKDRYVRGELELDEYEAHLERLLHEPVSGGRDGPGPRGQPAVHH